ncbi:endonuclease YncB(thermonuclease family) [Mesoflavibacter sabulilitoris]|uniref:Nuclease n=1 Tax=Mesoflavibacter zeaxanthinifaciens subsp. sabulilitoris TaxID=1520893 RepID=A0A2T1NLY3_9FLAO|nr:thermonuclease family protein [Mesoflavibacter zeaxanthinifaciens]MBB3124536.1 endonuclease YncB(thermonuclease family) [Mesoflavibacter zeaxanthinifaciens subsp. sabulilitoris]PSG93904.1 nuclease [Mesoflavibacter zeaxanthinifaciens subsp. sabulilitoris]
MRKGEFLNLITLLFLFSVYSQSTITGKVVAITDGDTFKLLTKDSTLIRVRVANIDCPERKQPFSKKAKQFTSDAIFDKYVKVEEFKKDRYGRSIAYVYYDNKNLSKELLKAGFAWHYVKYSNDKTLQKLEEIAKSNKKGLWLDPHAIAPWDWRSNKKKRKK